MSEAAAEATEQDSTTTTSESSGQQAPVQLDSETIDRIKAEVKADLDKIEDKPDTFSKDEVKQLLANQTKEIAQRITGEEKKEGVDPLAKQLLLNPGETLRAVADIATQQADERYETRLAQERAEQAELVKVRRERPDIVATEEQAKLFTQYYQNTDPNAAPAERVKEAQKEYDNFLESIGMGDAKKRKEAALSSSLDSAGTSTKGAQVTEPEVDNQKILDDELAQRQARRRKIRNLDY